VKRRAINFRGKKSKFCVRALNESLIPGIINESLCTSEDL